MEPNPIGGGYTFTGDRYYTVQFATRIEEFILNKVFEYCAIILLITDMIIFTYLLSSKKDIVELIALEKKKRLTKKLQKANAKYMKASATYEKAQEELNKIKSEGEPE